MGGFTAHSVLRRTRMIITIYAFTSPALSHHESCDNSRQKELYVWDQAGALRLVMWIRVYNASSLNQALCFLHDTLYGHDESRT